MQICTTICRYAPEYADTSCCKTAYCKTACCKTAQQYAIFINSLALLITLNESSFISWDTLGAPSHGWKNEKRFRTELIQNPPEPRYKRRNNKYSLENVLQVCIVASSQPRLREFQFYLHGIVMLGF